jgi:hypothetical protein
VSIIVKLDDILERIKEQGSPEAVAGMARFGITPVNNYGVSVATLRRSIALTGSKAARWIAADALRELCGEAVQTRLRPKAG